MAYALTKPLATGIQCSAISPTHWLQYLSGMSEGSLSFCLVKQNHETYAMACAF